MPNRILLIFITLLLGIGSASAQKRALAMTIQMSGDDHMR